MILWSFWVFDGCINGKLGYYAFVVQRKGYQGILTECKWGKCLTAAPLVIRLP